MPEPQGEVIAPGEVPQDKLPEGFRYVIKQGNRTRWIWWILDPEDPDSPGEFKQVTDIVEFWGVEAIDPQEALTAEQQAWLQDFNEREFAYRKDQDFLNRQEGLEQWEKDYLLRLRELEFEEAAQKALELFRIEEFDWRKKVAADQLALELERLGLDKEAQEFRQQMEKERFEWEKQQSAEELEFDKKKWEEQYALELERLGLTKEAEAFRQLMEQKRLGLDTTVAERDFYLGLQRLGLDKQAQEFEQKFAEKQFAYQLTKDQQDRLAAMIPQMATMSAAGRAAFKDILKTMGVDLDAMLAGMVRAQTPWMKGAPQWVPWGEPLYGGGRGLKPTGEPYTDEEIAALNAAVLGQGAAVGQGPQPPLTGDTFTPDKGGMLGGNFFAPPPPGHIWAQNPQGKWILIPAGTPPPPAEPPPPPPPPSEWGQLPPGVPEPPPEAGGGWWYDFEEGQWKPPPGAQLPPPPQGTPLPPAPWGQPRAQPPPGYSWREPVRVSPGPPPFAGQGQYPGFRVQPPSGYNWQEPGFQVQPPPGFNWKGDVGFFNPWEQPRFKPPQYGFGRVKPPGA